MIFPPMSELDPAYWASTFAGHMAVGFGLAIICGALVSLWVDRPASIGAILGALGYGIGWETIWQRLGAGLPDALVDTLAVFLGGALAASLWERRLPVGFGIIGLAGAILWREIRRRL